MRSAPSDDRVRVILQFNGPVSSTLESLIQRNGGVIKGDFGNFNARAVELPTRIVDELTAFDEVTHVSTDKELKPFDGGSSSFGHVATTTGAASVQGITSGTNVLNGTGIGIAVLDSGISSAYRAFQNDSGVSRVVKSVDFTGPSAT